MKQVNFSHSGGFPLEQETLERLQTAYRSELYEALKGHLSIGTNKNYIITPATSETKGWVIIHQYEKDQKDITAPEKLEGILYPIQNGTPTGYLRTTRTGTNLIYGTGASETAYFDYESQYISQEEYNNGVSSSQNDDALTIYYYDLGSFEIVKDIQTIEEILQAIQSNINAIEANIDVVEGNINAIETNINIIEADINLINQSYLPLNGSKAMQGDLDLGTHQLSKLDVKQNSEANVRAQDFKLGSIDRRGLLHPADYLGRALVDNSTSSTTNLTLNYQSDWANTYIGGKVYLDNVNATSSNGSLLVLDNLNQVIKSNTLIDTLLSRITALENKPATTVPIGMVAIWGKPAPFPDGWEEYVPLRGRMPVGLYNPTPTERTMQFGQRNYYENLTFYNDNGSMKWPFDTLGNEGGNVGKSLSVNEMPAHTHDLPSDGGGNSSMQSIVESDNSDERLINSPYATGSTGKNQSFPILNPYKVVQFIEYTGRPKDVVAPTAPTNLQVSGIGDTSVTLNWTASTDEYGVTNYLVYKNGALLATLGNILSYTATGLSSDTLYSFYVVAKDVAGNSSADSTIVNVTTTITDSIAPSTPEYINCYVTEQNQITVEWSGSTDNVGVERYYVYRRTFGGSYSLLLNTDPNVTSCTVSGNVNTLYYFKVRAKDAKGNYSEYTYEVGATIESGGGSCFDVESLVTMASGQSKKLKNIVIGDKLQGFSFPNEIDESEGDYMLWKGKLNEAVKAEVTVVNKRTSVQPNYFEINTEDTLLKVTGEHPLLVTQDGENLQWISAKNVVQKMLLIDKTGKTKAIESILFKEEPLEVAILDVEDVDNYVISGIVAHNIKPEDPV